MQYVFSFLHEVVLAVSQYVTTMHGLVTNSCTLPLYLDRQPYFVPLLFMVVMHYLWFWPRF